jgi:hypothetical protein
MDRRIWITRRGDVPPLRGLGLLGARFTRGLRHLAIKCRRFAAYEGRPTLDALSGHWKIGAVPLPRGERKGSWAGSF